MIKLKGVKKIYKTGDVDFEALKGIDLNIKRGEFVSIMGPSGSGKSTMMNIIGCLDSASAGEYLLDSEDISGLGYDQLSEIRSSKIGFVFQNFNLLPYATAYENVELPLIYMKVSSGERKRRVEEMLDKVGLLKWSSHRPSEMSGGQQQRIAIARSLVNDPPVILADEPTGNLDSKSGTEIMDIFMSLWKNKKTILMVTHDSQVAEFSERTVTILDGKTA